jgi:uncharacterized protein YaaQ
MKMVMAIVQAEDAHNINEALVTAGYGVTRIATTGGWLRRENVTLLIGVDEARVNHVVQLLQRTGRRRTAYLSTPLDVTGMDTGPLVEVEVGGATVFVLNVEQYERF